MREIVSPTQLIHVEHTPQLVDRFSVFFYHLHNFMASEVLENFIHRLWTLSVSSQAPSCVLRMLDDECRFPKVTRLVTLIFIAIILPTVRLILSRHHILRANIIAAVDSHPHLSFFPSPQGTDESYVEKQHAELKKHPKYILPEDKRRLKIEFGIMHYAGVVMYSVKNFLEKNKDVQQDMLFDYMRKSTQAFVRDITKFQVCV